MARESFSIAIARKMLSDEAKAMTNEELMERCHALLRGDHFKDLSIEYFREAVYRWEDSIVSDLRNDQMRADDNGMAR